MKEKKDSCVELNIYVDCDKCSEHEKEVSCDSDDKNENKENCIEINVFVKCGKKEHRYTL